MGKGKVGAVSFGAAVLASGNDPAAVDIVPCGRRLATATTVVVAVKAEILGREGVLDRTIGGNAHAVGSRLSSAKGPAATTVGLVTDVVDDVVALLKGVDTSLKAL